MIKDINQCRGCYKCVHDTCTASSCWFDRMTEYTDYARKEKFEQVSESRKKTLHKKFMMLWRKGLTDTRIASETCVSQPTVSKWRREAGLEANRSSVPNNGELIKAFRSDLNLTQKLFGEKYGVCQRTVCKWENGESHVYANVLEDAKQWLDEKESKGGAEHCQSKQE